MIDLADAAKRRALVHVSRKVNKSEKFEGFVVGLGEEWLLLHESRDVLLDGYIAFRRDSLKKVTEYGADSFSVAAHRVRRQRAKVRPDIDLNSAQALVTSLGVADELITLHPDLCYGDVCYIGAFVSATAKSVRIRQIDPDAMWEATPTKWKFSDITRIDFGGRYEAALLAVSAMRNSSS